MEIEQFLGLVRRRRSIRKFKPDPIPDEYVEKIIEAARWAMSGANAQPWEFIVIKDQRTKEKIGEIYRESRREMNSMEMIRSDSFRHRMVDTSKPPPFKDAPTLIVVCGDLRTLQASVAGTNFTGGGGPSSTYMKNMANATHTMQLAAAALGLGSGWISVHNMEQPLKRLLDVPDILEIHTIVPLGYPAEVPAPGNRRGVNELMHFEKYDRTRFRSGDEIIEFIQELRKTRR